MLSDCLEGLASGSTNRALLTKIESLYTATATYLKLGESAGFSLKVIGISGVQVVELRPRTSRNFAQHVLFHMSEHLVRTYERAEIDWSSQEPFLMKAGLAMTTPLRHRGIVVVVSDFLDPVVHFQQVLSQVMGRHRVVLVDVASRTDREFPVPRWWELEARRTPVWEGARHLEEGTTPGFLRAPTISRWNADRKRDRKALSNLVKLYGARIVTTGRLDHHRLALEALELFSARPKV